MQKKNMEFRDMFDSIKRKIIYNVHHKINSAYFCFSPQLLNFLHSEIFYRLELKIFS